MRDMEQAMLKPGLTKLYKFIGFAINFILLKVHPALNWNQDLLLFGLNRFLVARKLKSLASGTENYVWCVFFYKQNMFQLPWKFEFMRLPQGYHLQLDQHQGLHNHIPCILVARTKVSQECGQILEKPSYTCNKKNLLTIPWRIHLWARNLLTHNKLIIIKYYYHHQQHSAPSLKIPI